jgi:hypothetical protein
LKPRNFAPVLESWSDRKPMPWPISCSTVVKRSSVPATGGEPMPYHQEIPGRQVGLPTSSCELNCAEMSGAAPSRSTPARLLATACTYQVEASGAPEKSRCAVVGPADPRTAPVVLQVNGLNCAWILT